jgi:hypothetical protein
MSTDDAVSIVVQNDELSQKINKYFKGKVQFKSFVLDFDKDRNTFICNVNYRVRKKNSSSHIKWDDSLHEQTEILNSLNFDFNIFVESIKHIESNIKEETHDTL